MAKLSVSAEFAARFLFPRTQGDVKIVGAEFDAGRQTIEFTIEGDAVPSLAERVRAIVHTERHDFYRVSFEPSASIAGPLERKI